MKGGRSHRLQTHYQNDPHEDWVDGSWTVDCVCGVNFDDGEEMVNCDDCGVWVHTRCSKYVKGEELFTCDKCKRRKKRGNSSTNDDSDETEVAQLLVELPTKTIRLENGGGGGGNVCPPKKGLRLWTEIPMEERVHVQGIPGGDPALFSGFSKVFTPELWKCTGYVPKKFSFQYREFPCWDEKERKVENKRSEEENENMVDKGAGVLFSLSKESVFGMPVAELGGVRERDEGGRCERKVYSREMKKWEGENGEVGGANFAVRRERSALKPVVANSGKRRKEDLGMSKDWSVKKKARTAEKEMEAKKRVFHAFKSAFTSTSDAKPLEFFEERALKSFKSEPQSDRNKNLKDTDIQEQKSDSYIAVENVVEKLKNNLAVVELPLDALSPNISRPDYLTGAGLKEEKSSHEVLVTVQSSPKVLASAPEHDDCGRVPVKQEGNNILSGNLDDKVEGSTGRDVPAVGDPARASPEVKGIQVNVNSDAIPSSAEPSVQEEVDNDNSKAVLNFQSPHGNAKGARISYENISENSKMNDATLGGLSNDHKVQEVDRNMEAVLLCNMDKADELFDDPCQHKRELERSEGSMETQQCPPVPKNGTEAAEELSKSGETISSTPTLPNHSKMVVCVGKSSSTSSTVMNSKMAASDNIRSPDTLNFSSSTKQQVIPGSNTSIMKDRATSEIVTDGERLDLSTKTVKECPKSSMNSASKLLPSSKISHTSFPKRTNSDSKDSMHYLSPKASLAQNSGDTVGPLQIETTSLAQNKATASGLPLRAEKLNNGQSSFKTQLALLLHQELNSSPRVPRVPRVRHAGGLPHSASPTATNVLMKRTSSSGAKDNSLASRRKGKDTSKDGFRRNQEPDDEAKKTDKQPSSDQRRQDKGYKANSVSKRGDNGSPTAVHSVKNNIPPASTSTANSGPSSSTEVNDHHLSSRRNSPRNISDEETGTVRAPVHRTLPGLINEIMSKGRRMTYEELCNAVLPHWHNLRKHNGERYAYSSPSQAVLDCLRNRHEWAQLVDRGPKTSSSRKRRKFDPDESEDNDYGKIRTFKGESKRLESQREEVPKGKRKARKRRRLALQGRGIKDARKRQKADMLSDDDSGLLSNSSNETLFSEDESRDNGAGVGGSEATASSDDTETS
uniref:Zinc finger PHD-type domain-containing protein n=1 Tax=Salix viminalis TaxID=40686 RepID=A0A6N2N4F9_SALVM